LEIKQGSFIQQTQYFIPVEIDLSVVPARLEIYDFFTCPVGQRNTRSNYQSILHQKHYDFTDENNKVSFEGLPHKSSLVPQLDISD
jgi:hypothetical protein